MLLLRSEVTVPHTFSADRVTASRQIALPAEAPHRRLASRLGAVLVKVSKCDRQEK